MKKDVSSQEDRVRKGRLLRNGAVAFRQAASHEKQWSLAVKHREVAIQLLNLYLKERLFESNHRRLSALVLRNKLEKEIGMASLAVVTNHPDSQIMVKGKKTSLRGKEDLLVSLFPGRYIVTVSYPMGKTPFSKTVILEPKSRRVETFQPPALKPQKSIEISTQKQKVVQPKQGVNSSLVGWIFLGTGLAAAIVGGVLLRISLQADAEKNEIAKNPNDERPELSAPEIEKEVKDLHEKALRLTPPAWSLLGAGSTACLAGGIWFMKLFFRPEYMPADKIGKNPIVSKKFHRLMIVQ